MFIKIKPVIKSLVAVIVSVFSVGAIVFAWTEPSQSPPNGNVDAPLNTGATGQSKKGNLALNTDGVLAYGLLVPFGYVGIGTITPSQQLHIYNSNSDAAVLFDQRGPGSTVTFNYTGSQQTWIVPNGVTSVTIDMKGASGNMGTGYVGFNGNAGKGGRVQATISGLTPGETIYIYTGGTNNYNGGGIGQSSSGNGGGSSDIRRGGTALSNRVAVAGGGGGGGRGGNSNNLGGGGGDGGYPSGNSGFSSCGNGGGGGVQTSGGAGGTSNSIYGNPGGNGALAQGGYGGDPGGGGGGGGLYGGGGGGGGCGGYFGGGGGGGGSSYCGGSCSNPIYTSGSQSGNGQVSITYSASTWQWTAGVDQSDGGKFKISKSTALGTSDKLTIDASGNVNISGDANAARLCIAGDCKNTWQQASAPASTGLYGWCGGFSGRQSAMLPALLSCNQSRTYCNCSSACSAGYTVVQTGFDNETAWSSFSCYKQ